MKRYLLATLADINFVEQAKQLFSSVYFNAGWQGDYMLLAYKIPDEKLDWFRKKGILVKKCEPIFERTIGVNSEVVHAKLYLFTPEFKRWDNIVFLDADIIVRGSIEALNKVKGFAAVRIYNTRITSLWGQFSERTKENRALFRKITGRMNLNKPAFNSGVLAFSTDLIKDNTFTELKKLGHDFAGIIGISEEAILNLYFYNKWLGLPAVYNFCPGYEMFLRGCGLNELKGVILHTYSFCIRDIRPWNPQSPFYPEWKSNLEKAEAIDLSKTQTPKKILSKKEAIRDGNYLKNLPKLYFYKKVADKGMGEFGRFLKRYSPRIYRSLKNIKYKLAR